MRIRALMSVVVCAWGLITLCIMLYGCIPLVLLHVLGQQAYQGLFNKLGRQAHEQLRK